MKTLTIDEKLTRPRKGVHPGVFSYIAHSSGLETILEREYGRSGLCLKIFITEANGPLVGFLWAKRPLRTCTVIQNLFARHNLAPRVYDIVLLNNIRFAQVTDFIQGEYSGIDRERVNMVRGLYGIDMRWDMNPTNYIDDKLVDFQAVWFNDNDQYVRRLRDIAFAHCAWGSREEPYQPVSALGIPGQRDLGQRWQFLGLDDVDLNGKTALDIGCSTGTFCHMLDEAGAHVTGVDLPHVADVAFEIANALGHFNIDYVGLRLPAEKDRLPQFDVVFALSVDRQIGYSRWMAELTRGTFYLEGHVPDQCETFRPRLEQDFSSVEFLGMSRDHGPRPVFRCRK